MNFVMLWLELELLLTIFTYWRDDMSSHNSYDRITFSLSHAMNLALEDLKEEFKSTKADIIKKSIERFIAQQEEVKLQKAVKLMEDEYKNNGELTYLSALDSENFQ